MAHIDMTPTGTEQSVRKDKQGSHTPASADLRGGFKHDPEFWMSSVADGGNGGWWSSSSGEHTDPFFNPTQND